MINQLLEAVAAAENAFRRASGNRCNKFTGAVTTELLRNSLLAALGGSVALSPRDSFILGVPLELDLLVLRPDAIPVSFICYRPDDVLAALEIKNVGSFGDATIKSVKANFAKIQLVAKSAHCCYVALTERQGFRWAVTSANTGFPAYTLSTHKTGRKPFTDQASTADFDRLVEDLRKWAAEAQRS